MRVAKSYENWEQYGDPFDKNGKPYVTVKAPCPRCSGKGIIIARVVNGRQIPVQPDGGICYQCGGRKYIQKDVRLYTEKEYDRMKESAEKQKEKKAAKREAEMQANFEKNKSKWLEQNSFNEDGTCFIITGDSYSIKDELKAAGWRFSPQFLWHKPDPAGYEDRVIKINIEDIIECWNISGQPAFKDNANQIIKSLLEKELPPSESIFYEKDRIEDIPVTLVKKNGFFGAYGWTNIYTFESEEHYLFVWFTSTEQDIAVGDSCFLNGKVKERKEYRDEKQTIVTRCSIS